MRPVGQRREPGAESFELSWAILGHDFIMHREHDFEPLPLQREHRMHEQIPRRRLDEILCEQASVQPDLLRAFEDVRLGQVG